VPIAEVAPPPRKRTAAKSGAAPTTQAKPFNAKANEYQAALKSLAAVGVLITTFARQPADAMAIGDYASDETVAALADNATRNPYFGKGLDMISGTGGPMLELVTLAMPLGLQFLANHGVIKANPQMGIQPKEVMMARAAQAAANAQKEAQEAMAAAMAQLEEQSAA